MDVIVVVLLAVDVAETDAVDVTVLVSWIDEDTVFEDVVVLVVVKERVCVALDVPVRVPGRVRVFVIL